MNGKHIRDMSIIEIEAALQEDGYEVAEADLWETARTLRKADQAGCLLWTKKHIVSTLTGWELELLPIEEAKP